MATARTTDTDAIRDTDLDKELADVLIDEIRGYYWRESKWTTR